MSFPEQLRKARLAAGYTQQQVADAMGVTNSTYCGYETGKRQPDVAKIKQLAQILKTSGDVLLETGFIPIESTDENTSGILKGTFRNSTTETLLVYEELNVEHKKIIKNLMEQLLSVQKKQDRSET